MKSKNISFRIKLLLYFLLFAAIIFVMLWVLQTVFLQQFYNRMLASNARNAAEKIADNINTEEAEKLIDSLAADNSLLVFITETDGTIIYSSDSYKSYYEQAGYHEDSDSGNPYQNAENKKWQNSGYRFLPDGFDDFLNELAGSDYGIVEINSDSQYIYGKLISTAQSGETVLYVSVSYSALGSTAAIIRMQLLWVTVLSLIIAFVIAFFISRKFSKPIAALTRRAERLGNEENSNTENRIASEPQDTAGFCRELDELGEVMDQTDRKLTEAARYQKELLANVSHDLRTPLTMIRGYAEMVRDISWQNDEQREADIEVILDETDRLNALVNEILEYSKLAERGTADVEFGDIDMSELVRRVAGRFGPLFERNGGVIVRYIEDSCMVHGNEEMLERAVYNLIDNAIRHTGDARKIDVKVRGKDPVIFEVRDYGTGIDETELEHIWEKYYTSRMRDGKGVSGLGLAIVKQITGIHGGNCSAWNMPDGGCAFRIEIGKR